MREPVTYGMSQVQQCPSRGLPNPACNGLRQLERRTGTCHLLRLPNELLEGILDFSTGQAALAALALSSKYLQVLAVPHISKRVVFSAGSNRPTGEIYQTIEQYLSIPQINAIRARDPELLGPPPFLPGRYNLGVPPQVRFLTEAVISCDWGDIIRDEYLCVFIRNAMNLRLIQLVGQISCVFIPMRPADTPLYLFDAYLGPRLWLRLCAWRSCKVSTLRPRPVSHKATWFRTLTLCLCYISG